MDYSCRMTQNKRQIRYSKINPVPIELNVFLESHFFRVSLRFLNRPSDDTVFCSLSMSALVCPETKKGIMSKTNPACLIQSQTPALKALFPNLFPAIKYVDCILGVLQYLCYVLLFTNMDFSFIVYFLKFYTVDDWYHKLVQRKLHIIMSFIKAIMPRVGGQYSQEKPREWPTQCHKHCNTTKLLHHPVLWLLQ